MMTNVKRNSTISYQISEADKIKARKASLGFMIGWPVGEVKDALEMLGLIDYDINDSGDRDDYGKLKKKYKPIPRQRS